MGDNYFYKGYGLYEKKVQTMGIFQPFESETDVLELVEVCDIGDEESCFIAYANADGNFYTRFWHRGQIMDTEHALLNNRMLEEIFTHYLATEYKLRVEDEETLWRIIAAYGTGESSIKVNGANCRTMLPMRVTVSFQKSQCGSLDMLAHWMSYHRLLINLTMSRLLNRIKPEEYIDLFGGRIIYGGSHPIAPRLLGSNELSFEDGAFRGPEFHYSSCENRR